MSWELKPAGGIFPAFAPEWDRLNAKLYNSHPLFDSRFVGPLLDYFGDGKELLCVHRSSDTVDGALILQPAGLGRWKLFLPSQAQIGAVLLHNPKSLETLFPALPGHAWTIDLLAQDPGFTPAWTDLSLPRRQVRHALTMAVTVKGSFADYWQARHKQLRKNLRRYQQRNAERNPEQHFAVVDAPDQIMDAVTRFGQLESAGWKGREGTALSPDNPQGHFYAQLLQDYAQTGQASVIEFWLGEKLAASRLLICHQRMWIILKTTYDESLATLAPGRQLLYEVMYQAFARLKSGTVEFYTNATRDQSEWATDLRFIHHHQIYRNRAVANLHLLLHGPSPTAGNPGDSIAFDPSKIAGYTSIDTLPEDAINLLEDSAQDNFETSPEWFANLQRTVFSDDSGVRYYFKSFKGTAAAVLPVLRVKRGFIRQIEALGNFYTSLFTPPATPSGDLSLLLQEASRDHGQAHVMRFAPMDPATPGYESMFTALRSIGWIPFKYFCFGNWYQPISSNWQDYFRQRDGQLRSTIKRKGRKFATHGGNLEIITSPDQVEKAIAAFTQVYSQSWKKPEPYPIFVPGLIRWLANKGLLRLGIAWLNGQPIAAQLWIVNAGKASIFKLAYDEAYAQYAPGTLLTAHLMEHVIDRDKVREVDYLIGDDEHKKLWTNHRRERWGIVAYNPATIIGLALLLREATGRTLRKMMTMTHETKSRHLYWEIFPSGRFREHAARWDALQQECANLSFLESAFLMPLLEEFGTGRELLAFATDDGKPCAAALVTKTRFGIWQTFQPSQLPLGTWTSRANEPVSEIAESLLRALPGFNLSLGLTQIDPLFQPRPGEDARIRTMDYIDTAWVDIDRPFDAYWEERGKNLKTNSRKQRVKLQGEGTATQLECITRPEDVAQAIEDYGALESAGWKGKDGTAVHPDNAQGRFYRKMLENFCTLGRGRIYRYRFNDKVVAMDLCIEAGDHIVILKTAYDETYKTVSPSTLMRQDEFRELFNSEKFKRIEFYGKVMEWHTRWTENKRTLYHLTAYQTKLVTKLHAMRQQNS